MTILESLQKTVVSIRDWANAKFLKKTDIDSSMSSTSENPVKNKVISIEIDNLKKQIGEIDVSEQIETAISTIDYPVDSVNGKNGDIILTANDVGVYVQANEPTNAIDGDIWIDTANDPSYIPSTLPDATAADNGKVLMIVNGKYQLANLDISIDANGVISV